MPLPAFSRWTGAALAAGGALTFLLNAGLTPFLARGVSFEQTAMSPVFLWRQSLSALAVALLLFGSIGLYFRQAERAGRFGAVAFVAAFIGSALVLAWEWVDVFVLRVLAQRAPDALRTLEGAKGIDLYDLGALIPVSVFTLGWIALAASTIRSWPAQGRAAVLVIAGFFAVPLLSALLGPLWGGILGNTVLGSGFFLLGRGVMTPEPIDTESNVIPFTRGPVGGRAPSRAG